MCKTFATHVLKGLKKLRTFSKHLLCCKICAFLLSKIDLGNTCKRFAKHFLSCALARLVLQSPFMTKRLLKIASIDKNTINFVVELLFDEARLTLKETFLLSAKFILPFKTLRFFTKSPSFSL